MAQPRASGRFTNRGDAAGHETQIDACFAARSSGKFPLVIRAAHIY